MSLRWIALWLAALALLLLLALTGSAPPDRDPQAMAQLAIGDLLAADDAAGTAFTAVQAARPLRFPVDHGAHPDYRHEWWYVTGNLATADGRRFGYQLTLFRFADGVGRVAGVSAWRSGQYYLAHLALTDTQNGRFVSAERRNRGVLQLAGATAQPFAFWLDDWSLRQERDEALFPLRLRAHHENLRLDLLLSAGKPLLLQGDHGYSRKAPQAGNASYYYSYTRLPTRGQITLDGADYTVEGASWLDHEWGSGVLPAGSVGWDWFGLQLDNGWDLMYFRLRDPQAATLYSVGVQVSPAGLASPLATAAVQWSVTDHWHSAASGADYPAGWHWQQPTAGVDLRVQPVLAQQELRHWLTYWEGAVTVSGTWQGQAVSGRGYGELVGYAPSSPTPAASAASQE